MTLLKEFDKILGLNITKTTKINIPKQILELAKQRQKYRKIKDFQKADKIRKQIEAKGYLIEDKESNFSVKKI